MSNTQHSGFHETALAAVNEALTVLGQDVVLTPGTFATTSRDAHGRKAAYLYESARMRVLREHPWSFARREIDAAAGAAACCGGCEAYPWRAPAPRCARIVSCLDCAGGQVEFRIAGREIHAAEPFRKIVITADVEDLDKWAPDVYRALVLRLAADLAKPVTGRINERQLQEQAYQDMIAAAKLNDARESNVPYDPYGRNYYVERMRGEPEGMHRFFRPGRY